MITFLIGLASGIISGMGIGGGTILIPALAVLVGVDQHIAQSVNLLFFIPTAIIALTVHVKNKRIDLKMALPIIFFGVIGAFFGSRLAVALPGTSLRKWFGFFLLAMGTYEMFRSGRKEDAKFDKKQ